MKVYFLSGLGVDWRAFKYIKLPPQYEIIHLPWITPAENEPIEQYAKRISKGIDDSDDFSLVGLSFGGILSSEVTEYVKPKHTILISSIASRNELPLHYKIAGAFKLNSLFSLKSFNQVNAANYWVFGITEDRDKQLLDAILEDTDPIFSKWAVNQLLNWKRDKPKDKLIRIHGDQDMVLPITGFKPDYLIKGGGHFMISNRAEEISKILGAELGR